VGGGALRHIVQSRRALNLEARVLRGQPLLSMCPNSRRRWSALGAGGWVGEGGGWGGANLPTQCRCSVAGCPACARFGSPWQAPTSGPQPKPTSKHSFCRGNPPPNRTLALAKSGGVLGVWPQVGQAPTSGLRQCRLRTPSSSAGGGRRHVHQAAGLAGRFATRRPALGHALDPAGLAARLARRGVGLGAAP
jgi:hypothetical protein